MRRDHWRLFSLMSVAIVCLTGCTMCPDPYDYSGPVPDGSSPQNDFQARAGGILSLGYLPVPWPPVVEADDLPPSVLVAEVPATDDAGQQMTEAEPVPNAPDPDAVIR